MKSVRRECSEETISSPDDTIVRSENDVIREECASRWVVYCEEAYLFATHSIHSDPVSGLLYWVQYKESVRW